MKKKMTRRFWSLFAILALVLGTIGSAADQPVKKVVDSLVDASSPIEEVSMREEAIKYFKLPDGSYCASLYDQPVHYKRDGQWKEIDNSLVPVSLSKNALSTLSSETFQFGTVSYLQNKSNDFQVKLPSKLKSENPVVINYKGHTLQFSFSGSGTSQAVIKELDSIETATSVIESSDNISAMKINESYMEVPEQRSELSYAQVLPEIDLTYEISGKTLKECLIFNTRPTSTDFSFDFYYSDMTAVLQPDKSVFFMIDGQEEPIFCIQAPYMYDAVDMMSNLIEVTVTPTATGCRYTLTPDSEWLSDPERQYPIVLDPTVNTEQSAVTIQDNGVTEENASTNYMTVNRMYAGSVLISGKAYEDRIYIRLPRASQITETCYITSATFTMYLYPQASWQTASNLRLNCYQVNDGWNSSNITWNSQKGYVMGAFESYTTSNKSHTSNTWTITNAARAWYKSSSDNGLCIRPASKDTGKTNRTCFVSSDYTTANKRPFATINYTNSRLGTPQIGQEKDQWCWDACGQMTARTYNITPPSQSTICEYVKGKVINEPATAYEQSRASHRASDYKYSYSSGGVLSKQNTIDQLRAGKSITIMRGWYLDNGNRDGGHFTVIYGYNEKNDYFYIRDPWPVNQGASYSKTYNELVNGRTTGWDIGKWEASITRT